MKKMKVIFWKVYERLIALMPLNWAAKIFENSPNENVEKILLKKFAKKLVVDFTSVTNSIKKKKRQMLITEGVWSYSCFNVAYLNNMISLMVYALWRGYIPIIKINDGIEDANQWQWYFEQPFGDICENKIETIICDRRVAPFRPTMDIAWNVECEEFKIWSFLYKKLIRLTPETQKYIQKEKKLVENQNNMLGLLMRGTDYITLKPTGHPKQPTTEKVLEKAKEFCEKYHLNLIYVATEERRLFEQVIQEFSGGGVQG